MQRIVFGVVAALSLAVAAPALAQSGGRLAVGAQVGTPGVGAEVQFKATDRVTLRAGGDLFRYDQDFDTDDLRYAGEMDFSTASAFVDLHPFDNSFFVSGGAYLGDRTIDVEATALQNQVIGGQTFTPAEFGRLVGQADFGDFAPFVGLGYNNTFRTASRIGFKAVIGATFGEDPSVDLHREGGVPLPAPVQTQFDAEREQEERDLEDEVEAFKILPVVQAGLTFRF